MSRDDYRKQPNMVVARQENPEKRKSHDNDTDYDHRLEEEEATDNFMLVTDDNDNYQRKL